MSNNLDLTQLVAAQNNKETTINDTNGELDAAITQVITISIDSSNAVILTDDEFRRNNIFFFQPDVTTPTSAITVTVPAIERGTFNVINTTAQSITVTVASQTISAPVVFSNAAAALINDGSNVRGTGSNRAIYDLGFFTAGTPTASSSIFSYVFPRSVTFLSSLPGSQGYADTAPSAQTDFDIQQDGVSVGTITFAASSQTATFVFSSDSTYIEGQRLTIISPANLNGLTDLTLSLAGKTD